MKTSWYTHYLEFVADVYKWNTPTNSQSKIHIFKVNIYIKKTCLIVAKKKTHEQNIWIYPLGTFLVWTKVLHWQTTKQAHRQLKTYGT